MRTLIIAAPSALLAATALVVVAAKGAAALGHLLDIRDGDDVSDMRGYGDPGPYTREVDDPGQVIYEPPPGIPIHPGRETD